MSFCLVFTVDTEEPEFNISDIDGVQNGEFKSIGNF